MSKALNGDNLKLALLENNIKLKSWLMEIMPTQNTSGKNSPLSYCYCELNNHVLIQKEYFPFNLKLGNIKVNNGIFSIPKNTVIQISCGITIEAITSISTLANDIEFVLYNITDDEIITKFNPIITENGNSQVPCFNIQYETKSDIEIAILTLNDYGNQLKIKNSYISIQEINRQIFIDPLQYVNKEYGIEDNPVGTIINILGNNAPRHYLKCDGKEYAIQDYIILSNYINENFGSCNYFGGNGLTTFCVPTKNADPDCLYCIKYEPTYFYSEITNTDELLLKEITLLKELLDKINREVI